MRPGAGKQPTPPAVRRLPAGGRLLARGRTGGARRLLLLAMMAAILAPLPGCNVWEQLFLRDPYKPILAAPPAPVPAPATSSTASSAAPAPTPKPPPFTLSAEAARPGNPAAWGDPGRLGVGREFDAIYFNGQRTELDAVATQRLSSYAEWLRAHPQVYITLAGHAGQANPYPYAYNLGMARALAAADFLIGHGLEPRRIYTISFGKDRPLAPGADPAADALNNRVEVLGFVPPTGQDAPPRPEPGDQTPPPAETPTPGATGRELTQ